MFGAPTPLLARRRALLLLASLAVTSAAATGCASARPAEGERDLVVLLHGMGRSQFSMVPLEISLRRAGYRTLNVGYSSFGPSIAEITDEVGAAVDRAVAQEAPRQVHFVGHSLGTILTRSLLATDRRPERLGRVVMLAPPNQGSAQADRMAPWVGWMLRPIGELRTSGSTVAALPPPPAGVEIAIIAGDTDGKVTVDESRLDGATEHVVVRSGHTFIMQRPTVMRMVRCFLETGETGACEG